MMSAPVDEDSWNLLSMSEFNQRVKKQNQNIDNLLKDYPTPKRNSKKQKQWILCDPVRPCPSGDCDGEVNMLQRIDNRLGVIKFRCPTCNYKSWETKDRDVGKDVDTKDSTTKE